MPTPLDILLDPISLIILAIYGTLMLWEAVFPGRKLPQVKYWKLRGLLTFAFYFYLSSYLPLLINPYLQPYMLFDLTGLGSVGGGLFAIILYEFGVFVWHYALHRSDFLWKNFHQMHHSAERLDTYGAFYFSPFDMIGWTVLGSICFSLVAGLSPQAITIMLLTTNFFSIFQHANIKTPQWLGYIVFSGQRVTLSIMQKVFTAIIIQIFRCLISFLEPFVILKISIMKPGFIMEPLHAYWICCSEKIYLRKSQK